MTTDTLNPPVGARHAIDDEALDQLFRAARTHNDWLDRPVPGALLRQAVDRIDLRRARHRRSSRHRM